MAVYNLGRILPVFQGTYNSAKIYSKLDIVYYNGNSYVAGSTMNRIAPDEQDDNNTWLIVASAGSWGGFTTAEKQEVINSVIEVLGSATLECLGLIVDGTDIKAVLESTEQQSAVNAQDIKTIKSDLQATTEDASNAIVKAEDLEVIVSMLEQNIENNASNIAELQNKIVELTHRVEKLEGK